MHLEKRKLGKKVKYYLSHSYREESKIHKFRKYLGQDLNQKLLEERKILAEELILEEIHKYNIINDPLKIELSKEEIKELKKLEAQIPLKISHLSEKDWKEFSKIFTYNTNAIEGSKLNLNEVKELLGNDKWPDKSKEDIAEAFGVDEAISFIRSMCIASSGRNPFECPLQKRQGDLPHTGMSLQQWSQRGFRRCYAHTIRTAKEHFSLELIKNIHKIVFKNSKPFAGKFRKKGEEVVVIDGYGRVVHEGAPQARIAHLLKQLVDWYHKHKDKYPGIVLAAVVHNQFENIHPFADGNGRVGRILLNNILIKHNLPPINIEFENRGEYYASLQAYEKAHDLKPTLKLYIKEYSELKKKLGEYK